MVKKKIFITIFICVLVLFSASYLSKNNKESSVPIPVSNEQKSEDSPNSSTPSAPKNNYISFDSPFFVVKGEEALLSDGLLIFLKEINDSRCPVGVECFWEGELSFVLEVSGGKFIKKENILLGTVTKSSVNLGGYVFSLKKDSANYPKDGVVLGVSLAKESVVSPGTSASKKCFIGGCSGQICSEREGTISTCEFREEYTCYKNAICGVKENGECGWIESKELIACLSKKNM